MKINFSIEEFRQMIDAGQSDDMFIQNLITLGVLNNRKQAKIMSKLRETLIQQLNDVDGVEKDLTEEDIVDVLDTIGTNPVSKTVDYDDAGTQLIQITFNNQDDSDARKTLSFVDIPNAIQLLALKIADNHRVRVYNDAQEVSLYETLRDLSESMLNEDITKYSLIPSHVLEDMADAPEGPITNGIYGLNMLMLYIQ